jgi:AcrR family transcriptional regulator
LSKDSILAKVFSDRRRDPDGKREAILRTAVELFLQKGYARTALNDIAEDLKITKPALYHYFRNKEEILLECYRWGCLLIRESLDEIAGHRGSGLDKLSAFIRSYIGIIAIDFGRAVIRLDDGELSGEAGAEIRRYKREIDRRLRSLLQEGMEDGSIARADPKLAAFALAGALNWICIWYRPGGALSAEEIAESFVAILTEGLRNREMQGAGRALVTKSGLKVVRERAGKSR